MKVLGVFGRLVVVVLVCWMAGCVVSFLSGLLLTVLPIPWDLPLPWSDFGDFVETADGRVIVNLRFYNRALCYDRSGNFLGTYRFPRASKVTRLAAGADGLLYCRSKNSVLVYGRDWELLSVSEADVLAERAWELDRVTGRPAHAPERARQTPPDRPLPGRARRASPSTSTSCSACPASRSMAAAKPASLWSSRTS